MIGYRLKHFFSTSRWIKQHLNDPYVKRAQKDKYRSRAVYKLEEIAEKYRILQPGLHILDIGSAPGSWSQYIKRNHPDAVVAAIDLLPMDTIQGVDFYRGDVEDQLLITRIGKKYNRFDLIVSDVAPSTTGNQDHQEEVELNKMCVGVAGKLLKAGGNLVMKTFIGPFEKELVYSLQVFFAEVHRFKPKASRSSSFQEFVVCLGLREDLRERMQRILEIEYTGRLSKEQIEYFLLRTV